MSAIWGRIDLTGDSINRDIDAKMSNAYHPYKIDKFQSIHENNIYMACGLQFITAESSHEQLPLHRNNIFLTADCLLDNREELLALFPHLPSSAPDGVLILEAYFKWGQQFVDHLAGLYSIAIYDASHATLHLINDRNAQRCLYYYVKNNVCTFSTLLKPILDSCNPIPLNPDFIMDYLAAPGLYPTITSDTTLYEGIYKLAPASRITIKANNPPLITTYWRPHVKRLSVHQMSSRECGSQFVHTLQHCTQNAIRTQGKVGIAMSSGLDSSSIGITAADILNKKGEHLYSYTYVPANSESYTCDRYFVYNEEEDVLANVALHPNIIPSFLDSDNKNCYENLDQLCKIVEIPFKSVPNFPSLAQLYSRASEDGCRILLTGQCGNNTISYGNIQSSIYDLLLHLHFIRAYHMLENYARVYHVGRKKVGTFLMKTYWDGFCGHFQDYYDPRNFANPYLNLSVCNIPEIKKRLKANHISSNPNYLISSDRYIQIAYMPYALAYLGEIETKLGLYYGLVARDPSRDIDMLTFCCHIPYEYFTSGGTERWLISGNLTSALPQNYFEPGRYCVQNADWFYRLKRDFHSILPSLRKDCSVLHPLSIINKERLYDSLNEDELLNADDWTKWLNILSLITLSKVLQIC